MKVRVCTALVVGIVLALAARASADSQEGLLEELGLPALPGAKLLTQRSLPSGKLLDDIIEVYGPLLGLSDVRHVSIVTYAIEPAAEARQVFKFYEPTMSEQDWKTMFCDFEDNSATIILVNEKKGMLYMDIDSPGGADRELTLMKVFGKLDPSKVASPGGKLPDQIKTVVRNALPNRAPGSVQVASRIPTGQPISIPPSEKLHIRSTRSEIRASVVDRNTAEIQLAFRADDPGELLRVDERLVLALTPKLAVTEVILPSTIPLLIELTEGSLDLSCEPGGPPVKLSVVSTGAPVVLESFPLTSGIHTVKAIGGQARITLSAVQGGVLEVEVTGGDLILTLPRDSSAALDATVLSGKIQNFTGVEPVSETSDHASLRLGDGKAEISLRAIGGTVCIKYPD